MESERQIEQIQRARVLTTNFRAFQGYRLLPVVPVLLLWVGFEAGVFGGPWWGWALLTSMGLAVAGWALVDGWYRRTYGTVQEKGQRRRPVTYPVVGIAGLLFMGAWIMLRGWEAPQPLGVLGVLIGTGFVDLGWPVRRVTRVPLWSGIGVTVLALLPLGALPAFGGVHPLDSFVGGLLTLALLLTVTGIASHMALDRLLAGRTAHPKAS